MENIIFRLKNAGFQPNIDDTLDGLFSNFFLIRGNFEGGWKMNCIDAMGVVLNCLKGLEFLSGRDVV